MWSEVSNLEDFGRDMSLQCGVEGLCRGDFGISLLICLRCRELKCTLEERLGCAGICV